MGGEGPQASSITVGGKLSKAFVPTVEKKVPALEKYLLENKHPASKITEVIKEIEALGHEAGFIEDECKQHVDLLRKIGVKFKTLVEQREMAIHFNYTSDIHAKERTLKEDRKLAGAAERLRKQKEEAVR